MGGQSGWRFRGGLLAVVLAAAGLPATVIGAQPAMTAPSVVSLNVCTDQLAMLLAAPGQLLSVSMLSRDPTLSYLHDEAGNWPTNRGLSEEVLQRDPDVVVTGTFTLHNTTALLRRLGYQVAEFSPAVSLDDIRKNIRRMGQLLRREDAADALVRQFDTALDDAESVAACHAVRRPDMLTFGPNGITAGKGTLQDAVIEAAGFNNLGARRGASGLNYIPLETMLSMRPDIVLVPDNRSAPSLAERAFRHPALKALLKDVEHGAVESALWSCGGPFTAKAVQTLANLRRRISGCAGTDQ